MSQGEKDSGDGGNFYALSIALKMKNCLTKKDCANIEEKNF